MKLKERYKLSSEIRQAKPLKAKILYTRLTSTNYRTTNIHEIDKTRSSIVIVRDKLYIRSRALCGASVPALNALLLSEDDAYQWMLSTGIHFQVWGFRKECPVCAGIV